MSDRPLTPYDDLESERRAALDRGDARRASEAGRMLALTWAQAGVIDHEQAMALLHRSWWRRAIDWLRGRP